MEIKELRINLLYWDKLFLDTFNDLSQALKKDHFFWYGMKWYFTAAKTYVLLETAHGNMYFSDEEKELVMKAPEPETYRPPHWRRRFQQWPRRRAWRVKCVWWTCEISCEQWRAIFRRQCRLFFLPIDISGGVNKWHKTLAIGHVGRCCAAACPLSLCVLRSEANWWWIILLMSPTMSNPNGAGA